MSCSSCADRRDAIVRAGKAFVRGDIKTLVAESAEVARSSVRDASSALRQQTAAARQRLKMRR